MKRLGVFLPPSGDGMLVHRRVTPSIKFGGTHLYTWVERDTLRVKCLAKEHNTMSLVKARNQSARSRVERTNHEATAPPQVACKSLINEVVVSNRYIDFLQSYITGQGCILGVLASGNWKIYCLQFMLTVFKTVSSLTILFLYCIVYIRR